MKSEEFQRRYTAIYEEALGKAITTRLLYSIEGQMMALLDEVKVCGHLMYDVDRIRIMHKSNLTQEDFDDFSTRDIALECDSNPSLIHPVVYGKDGNLSMICFRPSICEELGMTVEGKLVII
jgi:hypothetical protein